MEKKKIYMQPSMEIVVVEHTAIMAGSGKTSTLFETTAGGDESLAKEIPTGSSLWEDED